MLNNQQREDVRGFDLREFDQIPRWVFCAYLLACNTGAPVVHEGLVTIRFLQGRTLKFGRIIRYYNEFMHAEGLSQELFIARALFVSFWRTIGVRVNPCKVTALLFCHDGILKTFTQSPSLMKQLDELPVQTTG